LSRRRPPEFYKVRVSEDGKILWRELVLTHVKDVPEEQRNKVIEEIRRLSLKQGRNTIQKEIARRFGVYVPERVVRQIIRGVSRIDWSRCGLRGQYRDLRLRQELYGLVIQLRKEGKSYTEIQKRVLEQFGVRLSKSQISYWSRGTHTPSRNTEQIPTHQIWWFIGLMLADGALIVKCDDNYNRYQLELAVKDEILVKRAMNVLSAHCFTKKKDNRWCLKVKNRGLYEKIQDVKQKIQQQSFEELAQMLGDGMKEFLRGFFDGDGSGFFVNLSNADLNLLSFIRYCLLRLGIRTSEPKLEKRRGTYAYNYQKKMWIVRKKDVYVVYVYPDDWQRFFGVVGTTLPRKRDQMKFSQKNPSSIFAKI